MMPHRINDVFEYINKHQTFIAKYVKPYNRDNEFRLLKRDYAEFVYINENLNRGTSIRKQLLTILDK